MPRRAPVARSFILMKKPSFGFEPRIPILCRIQTRANQPTTRPVAAPGQPPSTPQDWTQQKKHGRDNLEMQKQAVSPAFGVSQLAWHPLDTVRQMCLMLGFRPRCTCRRRPGLVGGLTVSPEAMYSAISASSVASSARTRERIVGDLMTPNAS